DWSLCAWCGKDFERPAPAIAATAGRPIPITPLPAADETGRIGLAAPSLEIEPDRSAVSRSMPRTRAASPRGSSPRTTPDVLPEG
ncbi:MAG TPA: hypothetical protein VK194_01880, partial [Candidatus Deferrimicrobium sp.]|nr:hypothetical protein [Candidatus Deferrimicrobium sp.]